MLINKNLVGHVSYSECIKSRYTPNIIIVLNAKR